MVNAVHARVHEPAGATGGTPPLADHEELRPLLRLRLTWAVIAWWTAGYGVLSWLVEWVGSHFDRANGPIPFLYGLNRVVYAVVWAGAIVVAIALTDRWPVMRRGQVGRILLHVAALFVVTVLWAVIAYYICLIVVPGWQPLGIGRMISSTGKNVLFGYLVLVILMHVVYRTRRYGTQEVAMHRQALLATEAQLHVLKMELAPHFLFNALQSISAQIHTNPDGANDTLVRVSDMLRHAIETSRVQRVALRDELATLRLYTEIEEVRFGERIDLRWQIAPDTLGAAVPHMLLQPLVENAIKHGLEVQSTSGKIEVAATRVGDTLRITIRDDGPGIAPPSPRRGSGVGLPNTRARLRELYSERHTFALSSCPDGGTEVTITLPFEPADEALTDSSERERGELATHAGARPSSLGSADS
jgi:signal transduction histidine kinase